MKRRDINSDDMFDSPAQEWIWFIAMFVLVCAVLFMASHPDLFNIVH